MNLRDLPWRPFAWLVSRRPVFEWLRARALQHPYTHIGPDDNRYMWRYWLFNPYGKDADDNVTPPRWTWLPSVRLHLIMRPDKDRHLHDHPWNARTIVLKGYYIEEREPTYRSRCVFVPIFTRLRGYTGRLLFGQYHRIRAVPEDGVWTMFWTWKKRGTWGFNVDGQKVHYKEYLKENDI